MNNLNKNHILIKFNLIKILNTFNNKCYKLILKKELIFYKL